RAVLWVEPDGFAQVLEGMVQLQLLQIGVAALDEGGGILRVGLDDHGKAGDGRVIILLVERLASLVEVIVDSEAPPREHARDREHTREGNGFHGPDPLYASPVGTRSSTGG